MIKKQKFGFTKSKAYGLCGAILATAVFATHANADEQTAPTTTPITENVVNADTTATPKADNSVTTDATATLTTDNAVTTDTTAKPVEKPKKLDPSSDKVDVVEVPKNDNLNGAIDNAGTVNADVKQTDTQKVDDEKQANADYDKQAGEIKSQVEQKQKELDAYNAEKARVEAENKAIAEKNQAKKDAYDKALKDYLNGTNAQAIVSAKTQNVDNQTYGDSFMKAQVDNQGNFTLTHDMNDGINIIGQGVLNGKIYYDVKSNGDGSEKITVSRIDLFQYKYTNFTKNQAVNQNINFHVYDLNGNEIYSVYHDGNNTFTADIFRQNIVSKVFNVKAGQLTDVFQVLNVDDNWVYNTHGQILVQFQNTNATPEKPLPTAPEQLSLSWHLNAYEKEKPVVPVTPETPITPITPITPEAPVQSMAVLPSTGEKSSVLTVVFGFLMAFMGGAYLKRKTKDIKDM